MSERIAVKQGRKRSTRNCQHHWIIETPHGATSRGMCKRCGTTKRFPNAAEDNIWAAAGAGVSRWSGRRAVKPSKLSLAQDTDSDDN